jgi:hypothetical protein
VLPREPLDIEAQEVEHRPEVRLHVVDELVLPVGPRAEGAEGDAHDARPAGPGLHEELRRHRGHICAGVAGQIGPLGLLIGEAVGRVPAGHRAGRRLLAHVGDDRPAQPGLQIGRQEPRGDALGRGDGIPHLLGGAGDLDLDLDAERLGGSGHEVSLGVG